MNIESYLIKIRWDGSDKRGWKGGTKTSGSEKVKNVITRIMNNPSYVATSTQPEALFLTNQLPDATGTQIWTVNN